MTHSRGIRASALLGLSLLQLLAFAASLPAQQTAPQRVSAPISFFEDADTLPPGKLNLSADLNYTNVSAGHDTVFPDVNATLGLTHRADVSVSTGYVHSIFETVPVTGISDTYIGLKYVVMQEGSRRPAVAVRPSLEVLGTPSVQNNPLAPRRANFLIPVNVQKTFEEFRVYSTTGYLTRGVFFQSLAIELDHWDRFVPTLEISHGWITTQTDLLSSLGLNRSRSDFLACTLLNVAPGWAIYANAGRSFGRSDPNTLNYQFTAGVSYTFRVWSKN